VDNPDLFTDIVDPTNVNIVLAEKYIIQEKYTISQGQEDYRYVDNINDTVIILNNQSIVGPVTNYTNGQYFYFIDNALWVKINTALAKEKVISPKEFFDFKNNLQRIQSTYKAFIREQLINWQQDLVKYKLEQSQYQQQCVLCKRIPRIGNMQLAQCTQYQ
jgi:hypothetical protein